MSSKYQSHGQILLAKSHIENISWLFKNKGIITSVCLIEKVRGNLKYASLTI